jgi:murein hydrolase activator
MRRALLCLALLAAAPLAAQQTPQDLEQSRRRLEEIRRERARLQAQQQQLTGQVTDVGAQLRNLERQREATNRLVNEIERQIGGLGSRLERSAAELALAQDNLVERKAVLRRRLADIYKRGPLYTYQVLLAAESFGDLLTRYKYLYLTSRQDRALVGEVERLTGRVQRTRNELLGIQSELDRRREEREAELERYARLASERQTRLRQLERTRTQTTQRLTALQRDEARLNDVLASLERARRNAAATAAARPGAATAPAGRGLTTADLGRLDWPAEGRILFQFGREELRNGGTIRRNGIGIGAPPGTPVKAVEAGTVALVQRLGTYGLTLILEHGNGYYSLYSQLRSTSVAQGAKVTRGQAIGTVGGEGLDEGPHLYFEIRGRDQIALDPMAWLKSRRRR